MPTEPSDYAAKVRAAIAAMRRKTGMTQREFAEALSEELSRKIRDNKVTAWERGNHLPQSDVFLASTLYRFYDDAGALLYVGITNSYLARWHTHNQQRGWWSTVACATLEHFDTRFQAITAEAAAIRWEKPRHNIAGVPAPMAYVTQEETELATKRRAATAAASAHLRKLIRILEAQHRAKRKGQTERVASLERDLSELLMVAP